MASFTLKQENIGRYHIEMYLDKYSPLYIITLSKDSSGHGLYSEVKENVTISRKNALATFYRYRKEARERSVNDG